MNFDQLLSAYEPKLAAALRETIDHHAKDVIAAGGVEHHPLPPTRT